MKTTNQTSKNEATVTYLTKKGMKEIEKSIANLEQDRIRTIEDLKSFDDIDSREGRLSRIEKLSHLDNIDREISEKRRYLNNAKLLPRKRDALKVALGSVVELADSSGRMMRYTLVNSLEADPSDGRISIESPLGKNLVGKTIKQTIEWGNGLRTNRVQLVNIA